MGGTRFIGRPLVKTLCSKGHDLTLFTRGNNPVPKDVEHLIGDRKKSGGLDSLSGRNFDVIIDTSGRELLETQAVIAETGIPNYRFLYVSSAGVYKKLDVLPVNEKFSIDQRSRHIGKAITEKWLSDSNIPFTSFRPTYIYGPGNYNPIERWFFDRISWKQAIPIPADGETITQLGHVVDLANAMAISLESEIARNKIYNCSGKKAVTFRGLISIAAKACNVDPSNLEIRSFDPLNLDPKARKAFPLRLEHFYTDISSLEKDLDWKETFSLEDGFKDSYENDYQLTPSTKPDFTSDQKLIGC